MKKRQISFLSSSLKGGEELAEAGGEVAEAGGDLALLSTTAVKGKHDGWNILFRL